MHCFFKIDFISDVPLLIAFLNSLKLKSFKTKKYYGTPPRKSEYVSSIPSLGK